MIVVQGAMRITTITGFARDSASARQKSKVQGPKSKVFLSKVESALATFPLEGILGHADFGLWTLDFGLLTGPWTLDWPPNCVSFLTS